MKRASGLVTLACATVLRFTMGQGIVIGPIFRMDRYRIKGLGHGPKYYPNRV
jgi:hypothetical protein